MNIKELKEIFEADVEYQEDKMRLKVDMPVTKQSMISFWKYAAKNKLIITGIENDDMETYIYFYQLNNI
jgi:hypothetical protein